VECGAEGEEEGKDLRVEVGVIRVGGEVGRGAWGGQVCGRARGKVLVWDGDGAGVGNGGLALVLGMTTMEELD